MKGERIMNRFRFLLFTAFVMAVTAFSSGISVSFADQQDSAVAKPAAEEKAAAAKRAETAAARAIAKRAELLQQRKASKEYIKKVIEGQQPGAAAPAPDNAGKEGAQ
jgi:hypothetical protein